MHSLLVRHVENDSPYCMASRQRAQTVEQRNRAINVVGLQGRDIDPASIRHEALGPALSAPLLPAELRAAYVSHHKSKSSAATSHQGDSILHIEEIGGTCSGHPSLKHSKDRQISRNPFRSQLVKYRKRQGIDPAFMLRIAQWSV
jgi:hypothetical protein